ncbi:glycerophosphoryl diester phosphodiesterase membrane domain-containing protein [Flammeovirga sp. EKP202]|uniref:glycerophosphoryl diester phosphodiesterase membrane domain-containing protein n=1 Tax=Flammeovirga sp. EKP202 TaxID=2770592 RepID=UPI00165FB730|nr:glycerophosphoryl diester phosphodiesterase membrane domain-containing protein [Flammeovirga sp. EKP202]MBD0402969.1 glycerophosphoryl diester phosphodiesterase membrane domain-containing protein [Flammeovirga sp. EKP202]
MQTFQFNQVRSLGEKIEFTFSFWAKNFKTILISVLTLATPFFLIGGGFSAYATTSILKAGNAGPTAALAVYSDPYFYIGFIFSMFGYVLLSAMATSMVKVYLDKELEFTVSNIRSKTLSITPKIIGTTFIVGFFVSLATLMFIIPGIYLAIAYAVVVPVLIFEETTMDGALDKSRKLVKGNWWSTLGFLLIFGFISSLVNYVFGFVGGIVTGVEAASITASGSEVADSYTTLMIIVSGFSSLVSPIFTILMQIGTVVLYFSLKEQKEATSLLKEAESMA